MNVRNTTIPGKPQVVNAETGRRVITVITT